MNLVLIILSFPIVSCFYIPRDRPDEGAEWSDAELNPVELLRKYKYPSQLHYVTTTDGYILTIHRIPYGRMCPPEKNKGPVILQHGIISSSMHFIIQGTKRGLGYVLADSCYDVWMPNSRGNSLSLNHTKYDVNNKEYWNFSWHELGVYDYPAVFDYVLNTTGADNVTFIGHSQASTSFLVFNSFYPKYTRKIRAAFFLAPIAYLRHSKSFLLQFLSIFTLPLQSLANALGIYELVEQNDSINKIVEGFCSLVLPVNPLICDSFIGLAFGFSYDQRNLTLLAIAAKNGLYGASVKQVVHYAQILTSNIFRQFDYGLKNLVVYGQPSPPVYNLTNVGAPIHLYCGKNDWLSDLRDVRHLMVQLPNLKEFYIINHKTFNHEDHLFAMDILELEYDHLLKTLDGFYTNEK